MISIAICDDETYMLQELKEKVTAYMEEKGLIYHIEIFESAEKLLFKKSKFDIIFLDIQMNRMSGMQAAQELRLYDDSCCIIFVTVLKELVFEAFEVNAANYLLKPLSDRKLAHTLDRVVKQLEDGEGSYLTIHKAQSFWQVRIDDILYCEVIKRIIYIHQKDSVINYYEKIECLEKNLPSKFFRCHRSYIINLQHVKGYQNNCAIMKNGDSIPVSRLRQQDFSDAMLDYLKKTGR